jgi:hypothetical protein
MKRSRFPRRNKNLPDVDALMQMATSLSQAGSRLEDIFWESRLTPLIDRLLSENSEETLDAALDGVYGIAGHAYDELADLIEARAESRRLKTASGEFDVLLIAAPVLAWSRYSIPANEIAGAALTNIRVQIQAHVLAADCRLGLASFLFSPDQLPRGFGETAALADKLAQAALHNRDVPLDPSQLPETNNFLSDIRYVIGAVVAPRGAPLFRWQEDDGDRNAALKQWREQGGESLRPLLPACAMEALLPQAYHAACRDADHASRPYALRASIAFLNTTLNVPSGDLRAVVAPYYDQQLQEFRVGFTMKDSPDVVHGVVWPLLESEDEAGEAPAQITAYRWNIATTAAFPSTPIRTASRYTLNYRNRKRLHRGIYIKTPRSDSRRRWSGVGTRPRVDTRRQEMVHVAPIALVDVIDQPRLDEVGQLPRDVAVHGQMPKFVELITQAPMFRDVLIGIRIAKHPH